MLIADSGIVPDHILLPPQWLGTGPLTCLRIYNPAIFRCGGRLLMAYRVDSGRQGIMQRRIGLCPATVRRDSP